MTQSPLYYLSVEPCSTFFVSIKSSERVVVLGERLRQKSYSRPTVTSIFQMIKMFKMINSSSDQ